MNGVTIILQAPTARNLPWTTHMRPKLPGTGAAWQQPLMLAIVGVTVLALVSMLGMLLSFELGIRESLRHVESLGASLRWW